MQAKNVHGGNVYKFAAAHGCSTEGIIDFSANINPLGMSRKGKEAMQRHINECIHYPDPEVRDLRRITERVFGVPGSMTYFGNGAAELLYAITRVRELETAYVPEPGFSEYREAATAAGLAVKGFRLTQDTSDDGERVFSVPYKDLTRMLETSETPVIVFLGNPNNPDGTLLDPSAVRTLATAAASSKSLVLVDESFIEFTDGATSVRSLVGELPSLAVLHSLTKFYAIPGLRLGMLFYGGEDYQEELCRNIPAWSVNHLAQCYGAAALTDVSYIEQSRQAVGDERAHLYGAMKALPFMTVCRPSVNFMLCRWLPQSPNFYDLYRFLESRCVLIRDCSAYEGLGDGWFRIAVKERKNNELLIRYIKEFAYEHDLFGTTWTD